MLKRVLSSSPLLSFPKEKGEFILDTDASNIGIGAVPLSEARRRGENYSLFYSRVLNKEKAERNYYVTRREFLAIVDSLKFFRHYLLGQKFLIRTDHASLKWLLSFKDLESQLTRLQRFQFEIIYRKGLTHKNADGLSRRQCESSGCKYCCKVEQKDIQAHSVTAQIIIPEKNLGDWRREQREDTSLTKILHGMEKGERPSRSNIGTGDVSARIYLSYWDTLVLKNGVLYKR